MPRWLGALVLIALGITGIYQWIKDPCVRLRGSKRPLNKWQGRLFYGLYSLLCLGGGVAIWLTR
jgi:hypothetical protein